MKASTLGPFIRATEKNNVVLSSNEVCKCFLDLLECVMFVNTYLLE